MPNVDNRVVQIQFDNAGFEQKVQATLQSLANLDKALQFENGKKGLADITTAAANFNLNNVAGAVDNISSKFTAMGAIGFSVIQSLTQSAVAFVERVGGDILSPILEGGFSRSKAIEHAKFMFEGLGVDIEQAMASAKAAVLGTAYGLGDAANAAAQFAASGINVGADMTAALRGVAGAAAMTGASFKDIAYIYSGIAGQNKVNSQDLMQFSTRGLNAAAAIAKAMGISEQAVRDMVSNGEMDFATFAKAMDDAFGQHATEANKTFEGALANMKAALSRLGASFISPQLTNFRDIFNSLTPVIDDFTAAIKPAIDTFSQLTTFVTSQFTAAIKGISFDNLRSAMPNVVEGMKNLAKILEDLWRIGKEAFKEIFPPSLGVAVINVATWFRTLTENLQISGGAAGKLRSIFEGFFSALSIGWTIIKEGAEFLGRLGKSIAEIFGPGVVGVFTGIGDALTKLHDSLVTGGGIESFFEGLTQALEKPLEFLEKVKDAISNLFSGFGKDASRNVENAADSIGDKFDALKERLSSVWTPFIDAMGRIGEALSRVGEAIGNWLHELWDKLAANISSGDFNNLLDAINTTLLGAIAGLMAKFLKGGFNFNFIPGIANLGGTLNQLTNSLAAMQGLIKAQTLMKIAEAIGLLTASIVVLSLIDSAALTKSLGAITVGFGQLIAAFAAIEKLSVGPKGAVDFAAVGAGMLLLAGSLVILSLSVKIMSDIDWDGLAKGLLGTVVLLGALALAVQPLSANSAGMVKAGVGIGGIATGMLILSVAVKIMSTLSWEELAKGLLGVAVGLGAVVLAINLLPNDAQMIKAGASIFIISTAMAVLGGAVSIFANMDWESLSRGLLGMGVGLGAIVLAVNLMPKDLGGSAGSILLVAGAVLVLANAIKSIAGLSWEDLGKGLAGVAVSLTLLVGASILMEGAIPGAMAMVLVAGAILILSRAIETIGSMNVGDLVQGLIGMAAGMAILAVSAAALSVMVPEMMAFGAALVLLGAGFALLGASAWLLAEAFKIIAETGEAAAKALPDVLEALANAIPSLMQGLAEGIVELVKVFTDAAPVFAKAIGILLEQIIDTFIKLMPKLTILMGEILQSIITLIYQYTGPLVEAGMHVLISFLQGISNNIEQIVTIVADIVTKFLDQMAQETPRVVSSLVNLIGTWFTETARGLGELLPTLLIGVPQAFFEGLISGFQQQLSGPVASFFTGIPGQIAGFFAGAATWLLQAGSDIIQGLLSGLVSVWNSVTGWLGSIPGAVAGFFAGAIGWLVQAGSDIIQGLWNGLVSLWNGVVGWFGGIPGTVIGFFAGAIGWLLAAGGSIIQGLWDGITGLWDSVVGWFGEIPGAIQDIFKGAIGWLWAAGVDIVQGLWDGIRSIWGSIKSWIEDKVGDLIDTITHPWEIFSPSHLMRRLGVNIMKGWELGLKDGYKDVHNFVKNMNTTDEIDSSMSTGFSRTVSNMSRKLSDLPEFQPTITPVLDLTRVAAEAGKINGYLQPDNLTPVSSYRNAYWIAREQRLNAQDSSPDTTPTKDVVFNQTINAPTQLSAADIYKQTRNQITMAKEELKIP